MVAATVARNNVSYSYDAFDVRVGCDGEWRNNSYPLGSPGSLSLLVDDGSTAYHTATARWRRSTAAATGTIC
ncbi:MAG: hypothetical protein R2932_47825 [Caldilineaceae bacterium]